jgi:hypothetical protein
MIKNYWKDEQYRILMREIDDNFSWEEYHCSVDELRRMIVSVEHSVVLLTDWRKVRHIPENALEEMYNAFHDLPVNLVGLVFVFEHRWIEVFMQVLLSFFPGQREKFRFVRTMEKANKQAERLLLPPKKRRKRAVMLG